jgi:hypothetical protein
MLLLRLLVACHTLDTLAAWLTKKHVKVLVPKELTIA